MISYHQHGLVKQYNQTKMDFREANPSLMIISKIRVIFPNFHFLLSQDIFITINQLLIQLMFVEVKQI
jgi:hypothetical protein